MIRTKNSWRNSPHINIPFSLIWVSGFISVDSIHTEAMFWLKLRLGWLSAETARGNVGHYQSTMTSHNDPRSWCLEGQVCFVLKFQTSMCTAPCTHAFITLRDDRHPGLIKILSQGKVDNEWEISLISKYFFINYT